MNIWTMQGIKLIPTNGIVKTNGTAVMGAGLAKQAANLYPELPAYLGSLIKQYGNRAFNLGNGLASFPTKYDYRADSDLLLIKHSAEEVVKLANKFGWQHILVPRVGCGLGKLEWRVVKKLLDEHFDSRFIYLEE